ncbi:ribosomal L1 domain-containing protein 1 isoform X1 [Megachile rotundata]|uniref:ribosomal L1 domain-containing protein 1 isoform X1 n=1 Tax=Megachile rotundata TaxID=143995 RepID=UPI003FCF31C5
MVSSRNSLEKRKKSKESLHRLNGKSLKLKPKGKLDKLSKEKIKQKADKSLEPKKIVNTLDTEKVISKKSVNKKLTNKIQEKVDVARRLSLRSSQKKNIHEVGKAQLTKFKNHVGDSNNLKSNEKRKTVKATKNSRPTKLQSLKRKRLESDNNKENTNSLSLEDLSREHIVQCISAIFHLTEEQLKNKNALFDGESTPIFMQVTCIKVPKTPKRCMRILLPHSIVSSDDEVALFVGDLQKGRRKDYEPTIEHYQELLQKHSCTNIKTIIPMNQVKTEYDQFELKRKLVNSYDHFLVDGKIAGHLSHLLGKEFYTKRKLPTPIRMQSKDLKHEIEFALRKTLMQIHSFGDSHIVQVGHTLMNVDEILENILAACNYLSKNYPGGWDNIRSIRIKTSNSLALPIYTTLKNKNSVKLPVVEPKRPKAYRDVSGELSTTPSNTVVTVTPEGSITVDRKIKRFRKPTTEEN